jgi:hypothetical protein
LTPRGTDGTISAVRGLRFLAAAGVLALASRVSGESLGEAAAREQARREAARGKAAPTVVVHEEELKNAHGRIANDPNIRPATPVPPRQPTTWAGPARALTVNDITLKENVAREILRLATPSVSGLAPDSNAQDDLRAREAYWRAEARRRREEAAATEEALREVERWSDPTYAGKDKPSCPITRNTDRRKARADAARAREALKSLDEEARVGGALPGWVRE